MMIKKIKRSDQGFTLIELMTVMAIIGILATAIIMSLSSHKKRAEGTKALTELSGVMQNIYLCIADEGVVPAPSSGQSICSISDAYGLWPSMTDSLANYSLSGSSSFTSAWYYQAVNSTDSITICCNSLSGRCENLESGGCNATTILK